MAQSRVIHSYSQPVRDDGVSSFDTKITSLQVREDRVCEVRGVPTVETYRVGDFTKQVLRGRVQR